jgi:anti-sigma regulatory factor (Ser/Thr protein kinase)
MGRSYDDRGATVEFTVASNLEAARTARRRVEDIRSLLDETMHQDLRLLLSELITNAVQHSGIAEDDPIRVIVRCSPGFCQAEVWDGGMGFEAPTGRMVIPQDAEAGYGLVILAGLASRWAVERVGEHTRVWFELQDTPGLAEER